MTNDSLIPSIEALDATAAFDDMLAQLGDETRRTTHGWATHLWEELGRGGWFDVGDEATGGLSMRDLVDLMEVWGRHRIPLPFLPTLLCHRVFGLTGLAPMTSFIRSSGDRVMVPFSGFEGVVLHREAVGDGCDDASGVPAMPCDSFSELLPLGRMEWAGTTSSTFASAFTILACAQCVGAARWAVERAASYSLNREQYGQPIGRYQALKHLLADAFVDVQLARSTTIASTEQPDPTLGARRGIRLSRGASLAAIQAFGAMGFTWDVGIHHAVRLAMSAEALLRGVQIPRLEVEGG
jgi:alkylation response protein AidB-like acyl-CoA dehydrogenase